ncbi:hypothetical protein V5D56_02360 [Cellulosimicrobium sp. PMB13]|uniref:hypothetical protein n=1 Tax=Cellulosimicrobium sp. PMB13 TaxID=3120158 RepID=UPI003F4C9A3A
MLVLAGGVVVLLAGVGLAIGPALAPVPGGATVEHRVAAHVPDPPVEPRTGRESLEPQPAEQARPVLPTNGIRDCSSADQPSQGSVTVLGEDGVEYEHSGMEGPWSRFAADEEGNVLPVEQWPLSDLEHAVIAQVETTTRTVLMTFDRRTCAPVPDYVAPALDHLPPSTVVVLDVETGEVVAQEPVRLVGAGSTP